MPCGCGPKTTKTKKQKSQKKKKKAGAEAWRTSIQEATFNSNWALKDE